MKYRKSEKKRYDRKRFTRTSVRTQPANRPRLMARGGIRM